MSPAGASPAGAGEDEHGDLRADLLMARQALDGHVAGLGKLQAEFAASRMEVAELRTLVDNQQEYVAALEMHASELRAVMAEREIHAAATLAELAATRDTAAARLAADHAAVRSELDRLLASASWRMTRPWRALAARMRRS